MNLQVLGFFPVSYDFMALLQHFPVTVLWVMYYGFQFRFHRFFCVPLCMLSPDARLLASFLLLSVQFSLIFSISLSERGKKRGCVRVYVRACACVSLEELDGKKNLREGKP